MMPKRPSPKAMQQACDLFNSKHPVGSDVLVWPGFTHDHEGSSIAGRDAKVVAPGAYVMGGHTAVVQVDGGHGCIALNHVRWEGSKL